MRGIAFIVLLTTAATAQVNRVGIEIGGTANLRKHPLLYTRLAYSTPIGVIRSEAGVLGIVGRDGGFGFDVLISRPISKYEPVAGVRFLVWNTSMSIGFPTGMRYQYPFGGAELTFGITVAPTLHLASEERHTFLFDTFIGVRF